MQAASQPDSAGARGSGQCESLDEVRANIDRLDHQIVQLLSERSRYVQEAVRFKATAADVEAPKRVEQVIGKVRALAYEHGLQPHVAERVYRAMIGASIELEHDVLRFRSATP